MEHNYAIMSVRLRHRLVPIMQSREEYLAEPVARLAAAEHDMREVESHMGKLRSQPLAGVTLGNQRAGGQPEVETRKSRLEV